MESGAAKRQRLRRLKKQLATIELLLEEDSAAAKAATKLTTRSAPRDAHRRPRQAPPQTADAGRQAATTATFGARGGPANARLRARLKQPEAPAGDVSDAYFAAALQGNYRQKGPTSCDDTHEELKRQEMAIHSQMIQDAAGAATDTVDRIEQRMADMELTASRERAAAAAEARAVDPGGDGAAGAAGTTSEARAALDRIEAQMAAMDSELDGVAEEPLPEEEAGEAEEELPERSPREAHSVNGVVGADAVNPDGSLDLVLNIDRGRERFDPAAAADQGRAALRGLAKDLWRTFNKELAKAGPPRMPPRLRLPPAGWSKKDLEKLEIKIVEAGGVPIRTLAAFAFQSSGAVCGPARHTADPMQKEICAICLAQLDHPAGSSNQMRLGQIAPSWLRELPCGHCFHPSCVCDWLLFENKCPMCRHDLRDYQ